MKGKFIVPKIALLVLALCFLAQKFLIAHTDLKNGRKERLEQRDFSESADVQPTETAPIAYSQTGETTPAPEETEPVAPTDESSEQESNGGVWGWIKQNWAALILPLFALLEAIVRLTPTNTDNSILNFLKAILDWILPNKAKDGDYHK
ncbi:MAG: hypothetical protein EPGJADBJ_04476 [Saprospiraceae bacterium]|nr:hypothetical protein [Saprospiraceae bacterium]